MKILEMMTTRLIAILIWFLGVPILTIICSLLASKFQFGQKEKISKMINDNGPYRTNQKSKPKEQEKYTHTIYHRGTKYYFTAIKTYKFSKLTTTAELHYTKQNKYIFIGKWYDEIQNVFITDTIDELIRKTPFWRDCILEATDNVLIKYV